MSLSVTEPHYYIRSLSDKHPPSSTSSPTSPPSSLSPIQDTIPCTMSLPNTCTSIPKNHRKRRFHHINTDSDDNENQDIDINNTSTSHKKPKLSRTVKFTLKASKPSMTHNRDPNTHTHTHTPTPTRKRKIKRIRLTFNNKSHNNTSNTSNNNNKQNLQKVISREASLDANSAIINKKRVYIPRIEEYEVPTSHHRSTRRNPFVCCYEFFNGYRIGIAATLGARNDLKAAIKILSQELVSTRAKASIETQKNCFLIYIKTRKDTLIGCGILHIDHVWKRVNIEMFAVDINWRGNGFASMMVYLIQYRMVYFAKYDLFVCAANAAVPFWSNDKYKFVLAHKGILEQHEVEDEKTGGTKHFIWYGTSVQARCNLLKCFVQTE